MTRGVMHDKSLLMIHFTKICIISNVIFGSQVIFTLVRIIQVWLRISNPPQLTLPWLVTLHRQLFWLAVDCPLSSLPWSWLTLLTQQWVHHRHHAPTFTSACDHGLGCISAPTQDTLTIISILTQSYRVPANLYTAHWANRALRGTWLYSQ